MFVPGFKKNNQNTQVNAGKIELMNTFYAQMNRSVSKPALLAEPQAAQPHRRATHIA